MRRFLKRLGLAAALLLACALMLGYNAARWLSEDDQPARADAIVVLAGRYERSMHAADLYRAGQAPVVVVSEAVREKISAQLEGLDIHLPSVLEVHRRVLLAKGVPADRIEVLGKPALSTADESAAIVERFGRPGRSLIIVTSPSHVLRARMIIERALEGRGVKVLVCATPYETFASDWWTSQDAAREVLLEWTKILFYLGGGRFRAPAAS